MDNSPRTGTQIAPLPTKIPDVPIRITHVAMFLGYEKRDGHPVIINASDGRSYRRKPASGYGVFDFVVPREGGRSRLVGYGTPPGLMVEKSPKG